MELISVVQARAKNFVARRHASKTGNDEAGPSWSIDDELKFSEPKSNEQQLNL